MPNEHWHAGRILFALARHFDWWQNRMITEFEVDGGRADLAMISKAGYVTEIEIKVSVRDWRADQHKLKWMKHGWTRPHIARFFYAVPSPLANKIPEWVPTDAGILIVRGGPGFDTVKEQRAARRYTARPLSAVQLQQIDQAYYYRFWRQHMEIQRQRLHPAVNH